VAAEWTTTTGENAVVDHQASGIDLFCDGNASWDV
jgi:hypothetical protein